MNTKNKKEVVALKPKTVAQKMKAEKRTRLQRMAEMKYQREIKEANGNHLADYL